MKALFETYVPFFVLNLDELGGKVTNKEGRTGGVSGTVHGPKKQRITNHGYQNFTFPNHENQHVKHFYLVSV